MKRSKNNGQVIVISAPSGAGKGTVINELFKRDSKSRWLSVSAKTRKPRPGEVEGVDLYSISEEDFQKTVSIIPKYLNVFSTNTHI